MQHLNDPSQKSYDYRMQAMSTPYQSNVYRFGSWKPGIAPLGALSHRVLGLRLEHSYEISGENTEDCTSRDLYKE